MAGFNQAMLMGYLTDRVGFRTTGTGLPVGDFRLAVTRRGRDGEQTLFMPVTVYGKTAENCSAFLGKGSAALVRGWLKQESWTDREGRRCSSIRLIAEDVQFLQRKEAENAPAAPVSPTSSAPSAAGQAEYDAPLASDVPDDIPF